MNKLELKTIKLAQAYGAQKDNSSVIRLIAEARAWAKQLAAVGQPGTPLAAAPASQGYARGKAWINNVSRLIRAAMTQAQNIQVQNRVGHAGEFMTDLQDANNHLVLIIRRMKDPTYLTRNAAYNFLEVDYMLGLAIEHISQAHRNELARPFND